MLQPLPQRPQVGGVGGSHHRPGPGVAVLAQVVLGKPLGQVPHHLIDHPVPGHHVLQFAGAGVGGLHQSENALVLRPAGLQKGIDGIGTHIAVHRDTVHVKGGKELVSHLGLAQPTVAVGLSGGADVSPLDVGNDKETLFSGVADGLLHGLHALPAQFLVVGGLGLHGGDHVAQSVHQPLVELKDGVGRPLQRLAVLVIAGLPNVGGDILRLGVQPRHGGVFLGFNEVLQVVERHKDQSFLYVYITPWDAWK